MQSHLLLTLYKFYKYFFRNPLKKDTANTIKKLYKAKFKLKISFPYQKYKKKN